MPEGTVIALSVLSAHAIDLHRHDVTNSSTLAAQSQSTHPVNCVNQIISQTIQNQGTAPPETHIQLARSVASRAPDQREREPCRGHVNGQTCSQHQEHIGVFSRIWKFLAKWDCGPVSATIGIIGFGTTTVLAYYGLKLAIWTATKDYIEHCQADLNVGHTSEACQDAAHQQLPPPPFYGFSSLSNSTILKRNTLNGMLPVSTRPQIQKDNYCILMYATLANLLCWIVLYSILKSVARSRSAARLVQNDWSSQDILARLPTDEEACISDSDAEMPFSPQETPEELQATRIEKWLQHEDIPAPRLRFKRQRPDESTQSLEKVERVETWQETLEGMCREAHMHPPVYQILSEKRGGRTAWSCTVTVQGQTIAARYWYDGQNIHNSREDAAEMASVQLFGFKADP